MYKRTHNINLNNTMNVTLNCLNCKTDFETEYKHRDKKFCSRKCYFEHANNNKLLGKKKDMSFYEERTCLVCSTKFTVRKKHKKTICSDECRKIWSLDEKNKENRLEKSRKSLIDRYGVDSIFKIPEYQEKIKDVFIDKYGVSCPMHIEGSVEKLKTTFRNNHIRKLIENLDKHNLTLLDDYTTNKNKNTSINYKFKCTSCNNIFTSTLLGSGKIPICRKCHPTIKNSKIETYVRDILNKHNISHVDNNRKILNGKELDLLLTDYNIAIEANGNYWHSEKYGNKDKFYHLNKVKLSHEKNIKLIQFFEDEIILKKDIVESRILNLLGKSPMKIYARKCIIKEVEKNISTKFLNDNHLQGDIIDKFRYGLYYNNELVSIMTFGKKRIALKNKGVDNEYELLRFCNKLNHNVVGGFSKLLSMFIKNHNPMKILTFADIRWSGIDYRKTVYYKNNFKFIGNTSPNYWYVKVNDFINREHRFKYRKNVIIKNEMDLNKTEWEIMQENGYDRIWDCGSMKFEMNFS